MTRSIELACACGDVRLEVEGPPIVSAECHCNSCRAAGARLQALPGTGPVLEPSGGTRYLLYRKDRVRFSGEDKRLKAFRLGPEARTRRVVATCCNAPVFLEFQGGHWLSLYAGLWPDRAAPLPELRTMTGDLPDTAELDDRIPNGKRQSLSFFAKLLGAWIAMGFRSPRIQVAEGDLDV